MAKMSVASVEPGQRFEQRGGFVWQVIRMVNFPGEDVPHVQLVNARDPSSTKTVSINALLDRNLFRLIP